MLGSSTIRTTVTLHLLSRKLRYILTSTNCWPVVVSFGPFVGPTELGPQACEGDFRRFLSNNKSANKNSFDQVQHGTLDF